MRSSVGVYDVVVCGGGLAGVLAALGAARTGVALGLRVALLEERPVLGGNSSSMAGVPPHGATALGHNRNAREGGILEELRMRYVERTPLADNRQYWDRVLKEACIGEPALTLFMNTRITDVQTTDGRVVAVAALQTTTETVLRIEGRQFIEASGDAFIAMRAGARIRMGREAAAEYSERYAPAEADAHTLGATIYITALKRSYPVPFEAPPGTRIRETCSSLPDRDHSVASLLRNNSLAPDASGFRVFWWLETGGERNIIDDAEAIHEDLVSEMFSVWDHLKNRCTADVREAVRNYDLASWSLVPLKRGSRRVEGVYVMTEYDIFHPRGFVDVVGFGGFPIDLHPPAGIRSPDPPCLQVFVNELYPVPYRSLYCRNVKNLSLAGRCIGASHVALGSLRVMYTLGALGQAAGTAAALCAGGGYDPSDTVGERLEALQQRLLRDDLHLPGLGNRDPADRARTARVFSDGSLELAASSADGFLTLASDTAQAFPVPPGRIEHLRIHLRNRGSRDTGISWKILLGSSLSTPIDALETSAGTVGIEAGSDDWLTLGGPIVVPEACVLWILVGTHTDVGWAYDTEEVPGTRFAVRWEGSLATGSVHGAAALAPRSGDWISPNHHGRMPEGLERQLRSSMSTPWENRRALARKPYITLCASFEPPLRPYGSENVVNGISRATDMPNIWISDPERGFPQDLTLEPTEPFPVGEIALTFDSRLDSEDRMYGFPRSEHHFPVPVPELVRDYSVLLHRSDSGTGDGWVEAARVRGNRDRRRIHRMEHPLPVDRVVVRIEATNGAPSARVYEIRLY